MRRKACDPGGLCLWLNHFPVLHAVLDYEVPGTAAFDGRQALGR